MGGLYLIQRMTLLDTLMKIARGMSPGAIRLSIGLEDWHDIIGDLERALEQV